MNIGDLGEFGLINRFSPLFTSHLPPGVVGIGDDCAVIPFQGDQSYVISTDLLNENIHFIKELISPRDLGYKSLAVNLSDIAAMGGNPRYAFLSIGLPPSISVEWVDEFVAGFHQLSDEFQVALLGGDTTRNGTIVINVLVVGTIPTAHIKRRTDAKAGDIICCTGYLGDSGAGLKILLENVPRNATNQALVTAHIRPRPHVAQGAWLSLQPSVHAMMDISDGIASDIQRIMESSQCGARIEVDQLPLSDALQQTCRQQEWQPELLALTGGEDYCLLITIDPHQFSSVQNDYHYQFGSSLFPIGTILDSSTLEYTHHGNPFSLKEKGFDHFKSS